MCDEILMNNCEVNLNMRMLDRQSIASYDKENNPAQIYPRNAMMNKNYEQCLDEKKVINQKQKQKQYQECVRRANLHLKTSFDSAFSNPEIMADNYVSTYESNRQYNNPLLPIPQYTNPLLPKRFNKEKQKENMNDCMNSMEGYKRTGQSRSPLKGRNMKSETKKGTIDNTIAIQSNPKNCITPIRAQDKKNKPSDTYLLRLYKELGPQAMIREGSQKSIKVSQGSVLTPISKQEQYKKSQIQSLAHRELPRTPDKELLDRLVIGRRANVSKELIIDEPRRDGEVNK